jgi:hypothetical protein
MKKLLLSFAFGIAALGLFAQAQDAASPANEGPIIKFEKLEHNFGIVNEGDLATYEFKFTNSGKMPLVLTSVNASCGCTAPEWPKEPIAPGASAVVKAVYNSYQRPGSFEKFITVKTNTLQGDIVLKIKGEVKPKPVEPVSPVRNPGMN